MPSIRLPLLIVNFKAYNSSTGRAAVSLAKACERAARKAKVSVAVAVQPADIYPVSRAVSIPVFAQHIDSISCGSGTGSILAGNVRENGAFGTLLNHSERRISPAEIRKSITLARAAGLKVVVCAKDDREGKAVSLLKPDFVAVEPPELIGGKISVSAAKPGLIRDSVKKIGKRLLVGAGVKSGEDAARCIELGAAGILVASGVTCSENPYRAALGLALGLKEGMKSRGKK